MNRTNLVVSAVFMMPICFSNVGGAMERDANPHPSSPAASERISPEFIAKNRAEELKKHLDRFELNLFPSNLNFDRKLGGGTDSFYSILLTTGPLGRVARRPYVVRLRIDPELAGKIVDHLLADGFLAQSTKLEASATSKREQGSGYILRVRPLESGSLLLEENLGFDLKMLERLKRLRDALAAGEAVDASNWQKQSNGAWMCGACKSKMFIQSVGKCSNCEGFTSSGAHKLCAACSAKQARCRACGCAQIGPATAALDSLLAQLDGFRKVWDGSAALPPQPASAPPVDPAQAAAQAYPKATDAASGMTVTVQADKGVVSAYSREQRTVWQFKIGQRAVDRVAIIDGKVVLQPGGETLDLATGKWLWKPR